jgi:hypothetical protein
MSDTETPTKQVKGSQRFDEDFVAMDDPTFLAERKRVREAIQELTERMAELDNEFIRRARIA